jgi:hypothetical protein
MSSLKVESEWIESYLVILPEILQGIALYCHFVTQYSSIIPARPHLGLSCSFLVTH